MTGLGSDVAPVLLLTTTGRRTGRARTTPVIFIREGGAFVVSSENFGQRRPAAWPLNLDAEPRATVQLGSETMPCVARRLSDAEADRYWDRLVEVWPAHATYLKRSGQRHTFMLTPDALVRRPWAVRAGGGSDLGSPRRGRSAEPLFDP